MYISDYHYDGAISNNTAIHRGCSECPVTILCYSNSTATHSSAVFSYPPNSRDVWSQSSSYYNPIAVQRVSPSGISLTYQFTGYQSQRSGVYTCKLSDADGNPVHFSVGLYSTDVGMMPLACIFVNYQLLCALLRHGMQKKCNQLLQWNSLNWTL